MSERPEKRKVEFIESYWTGGPYGSNYVWNDNYGELVRCKDCIYWTKEKGHCYSNHIYTIEDFFCADGKKGDAK